MRKQLTTHRCVFVGRKTQIITSDEIALIRSIIMWLVKKDHYNVMKRKAFNLCILSMERIPNNIVVHNRRKNIHKTHIVAIIRNTIWHCYVRCEWLINPLKFTMLLTDPRIKHSNWNFRNAKKSETTLYQDLHAHSSKHKISFCTIFHSAVENFSRWTYLANASHNTESKTSFSTFHKFKSQHYSPLDICFAIVCHERARKCVPVYMCRISYSRSSYAVNEKNDDDDI